MICSLAIVLGVASGCRSISRDNPFQLATTNVPSVDPLVDPAVGQLRAPPEIVAADSEKMPSSSPRSPIDSQTSSNSIAFFQSNQDPSDIPPSDITPSYINPSDQNLFDDRVITASSVETDVDPGPFSFAIDHPITFQTGDLLSDASELSSEQSLFSKVLADHRNFYSPESLTFLAGGFVVGGAIANSNIDGQLHKHFLSGIRNANSDDWFDALHKAKDVGDGRYTLPIFAGSYAIGKLFPDSKRAKTIGTWGERSGRAFLVGAPPLIGLQELTGGSRPGETALGSQWHPLQDNNGVSGHSFMGALPFITAAKMSESPWSKATFYAGLKFPKIGRQ
jgi:hypothetical protein